MKPLLIAGILLTALGVFVVVANPSWSSERSMMRVGDMEISAEGRRTVPLWVGWMAIVGGVVLAGSGVARRRAS